MPNRQFAARVALGFRAHSGWAAAVALGGSTSDPIVLDRRHIAIAENGLRGAKQPYHAAEPLPIEEARALIHKCRLSSESLAVEAIRALLAEVTPGRHAVGSGVLVGSGLTLPPLPKILQSHVLLHRAEGEFFREVLALASDRCSLRVTRVREKEIWERGAAALRLDAGAVRERITAIGALVGPPWTQDEKMAALAAWVVLAESGKAGA